MKTNTAVKSNNNQLFYYAKRIKYNCKPFNSTPSNCIYYGLDHLYINIPFLKNKLKFGLLFKIARFLPEILTMI